MCEFKPLQVLICARTGRNVGTRPFSEFNRLTPWMHTHTHPYLRAAETTVVCSSSNATHLGDN